MKLNDFIQRPKKVKKKVTQYVLQNDAAELKYKKQIDDLDAELGRYRNVEAERDEANAFLQLEKRGLKDITQLNDTLTEQLNTLTLTVEAQDISLAKTSKLKETIQNLTTELSSTKSELKTMTKTAFRQSNDLSRLGQRVENLQTDNNNLEVLNKQAIANKLSAEVEKERVLKENEELQSSDDEIKFLHYKFPELKDLDKDNQISQIVSNKISSEVEKEHVLEKNKDLQSFADETSKINKDLVEKNKELRDTFNYWEKESQEVQIQLQESIQVEAKLKKWVSSLQSQESVDTSVKGELNKKVISLEGTIKDMGMLMDDLMKELTYLRTINKEYRKELVKPRYLSMGTIAKREGFKMPQGKENIRTQTLGNSAPTLLKFKAEGESNDN